jgi:hypothetical protein
VRGKVRLSLSVLVMNSAIVGLKGMTFTVFLWVCSSVLTTEVSYLLITSYTPCVTPTRVTLCDSYPHSDTVHSLDPHVPLLGDPPAVGGHHRESDEEDGEERGVVQTAPSLSDHRYDQHGIFLLMNGLRYIPIDEWVMGG